MRHAGTAVAIKSVAVSITARLCSCSSMAICICETTGNILQLLRRSFSSTFLRKKEAEWERRRKLSGKVNEVDHSDDKDGDGQR
jgi:hypothetical protein